MSGENGRNLISVVQFLINFNIPDGKGGRLVKRI